MSKKIKFEKVLKLRDLEEKEIKERFINVYNCILEEKKQLKLIQEKENEIQESILLEQKININPVSLNNKYSFLVTLSKLKILKLRQIDVLEKELEKIKSELLEKSKDKKIIEKLIEKEKNKENYMKNLNEQKNIDSVNILNFSLKATGDLL